MTGLAAHPFSIVRESRVISSDCIRPEPVAPTGAAGALRGERR